jgi:hypothetical protein
LPKLESYGQRIDADSHPPRRLVAVAMEFAMMEATDWNRILIAHFSAECARLGEA